MSFTAELAVMNRDKLAAGLVDAEAQLRLLPGGRVLRGVENSKLARRMAMAVSHANLRPRLLRIMSSAVHLLVHYSRLRDEISLAQLARAAGLGPSAQRRLGADLTELAALGLVLYRPGRGRGHASELGVPARFATDVLVRLQREGRWAPQPDASPGGVHSPTTPRESVGEAAEGTNASADAAPTSTAIDAVGVVVGAADDLPDSLGVVDSAAQVAAYADQKASGGGGGFSSVHLYSSSRVKPSPPSSHTLDHTSAAFSRGGERPPTGRLKASSVRPADVDWVLQKVFADAPHLRTHPGTRERVVQASAIRRALGQEFRRWDIARRITHSLPPVVDAPGGFVRYRIERMMVCAESPRSRRLRTEALRGRHHDEHQQSNARRQANNAWQHQLLEAVPTAVLAGLIGLARTHLQATGTRVIPGPSALAAEISTMVRSALAESDCHVGSDTLADVARRVLVDGGGQALPPPPAILAASSAARTLAELVAALTPAAGNASKRIEPCGQPPHEARAFVGAMSSIGECVACGDRSTQVVQRLELPQASYACDRCYASANADADVELEPWNPTTQDDESSAHMIGVRNSHEVA